MNITDVQKSFNRLEPGQTPGQRTTKIVLIVLGIAAALACIYHLKYRIKHKKKSEEGKATKS